MGCDILKGEKIHDMELTELRQEAEKLGYKLVPIKKYVRFLPCLCGCNRRIHWFYVKDGESSTILECKGCGIEAKGKTEEEAKRNWNKLIREKRKALQDD